MAALSRHLVYCTEPFRISFAGRLDVLCFDKTGTLTTDQMILRGVVSPRNLSVFDPVDSAGILPTGSSAGSDDLPLDSLDLVADGLILDPAVLEFDALSSILGACHDLMPQHRRAGTDTETEPVGEVCHT